MPNWLRTALMIGVASGTFAAFIIAVIWLIVMISGIDARVPTAASLSVARVMTKTPFGGIGLAIALGGLVLATLSGIGLLILTIGGVLTKDQGKQAQIIGTIKNCCEVIASKFKQVRTTAIIFGIMLTVIILSLLNSDILTDKRQGDVPDAFWIAFGVVLSAFATAIAKLVEVGGDGEEQNPNKEDRAPRIIEYRRQSDDDPWHWNQNCPDWPDDDYRVSRKVPPSELCSQCQDREDDTSSTSTR